MASPLSAKVCHSCGNGTGIQCKIGTSEKIEKLKKNANKTENAFSQ